MLWGLVPTIYYAHSMRIYDTHREQMELRAIRRRWPFARIINPNGDIQWKGHMGPYLAAVRKADFTVFSTYEGHVGSGVYQEVCQAERAGKPIFLVHGFDQGVTEWSGRLEYIGFDWKVQYARVVLAT